MEIKEFARLIDEQVERYKTSVRKERASLLVWFLINYFRVDEESAIDLVCDSDNDKGIDGLFVDDQTEEIYIFQSKYSPKPGNPIGDTDLRDLKGSRSWFDSSDNIQFLDQSTASQELKSLVTRLEIFEKISQNYRINLVFVTNKRFNRDANEFLEILGDEIEPWDIDRLFNQYTYTGKDKPVEDKYIFSIDSDNIISYHFGNDINVVIFAAKASEIVQLSGIQDRTLFAPNVRYGLGRTRVNKDIARTLADSTEHQNFFLYHNGITLVCKKFNVIYSKQKVVEQIEISKYSIVNGCQSTLSFYENKQFLTDEIKILMRVIQIGKNNHLSQNISYFTNNQNSISLKDLKSNDKVQQDLQDEFNKLFNKRVLYKIKKGEYETDYQVIIENDFASQLITSFYLKDPSIVHRKTENFTNNYTKIFNRNVSARYIYILSEMYRAIDQNCAMIDDEGIRLYKLTRFFFIYVFRLIFEDDLVGQELIGNPDDFYCKYENDFFNAFVKLFSLIVLDFNFYVKDEKSRDYFDYKNVLRNENKVKIIADEILKAHKKQLIRHPEDAFSRLIKR